MDSSFNFKRTFLLSMIISLSISALIGIVIFLFGDFGDTEARLLMTTLSVGGYSLTGLCCSVLYEQRRFTAFAIGGMAVSVIGFVYTILAIWEVIDLDTQMTAETLSTLIILAFSTAHASLLMQIRSEKGIVNGSLAATLVFIAIVAFMLIYLVLNGFGDAGEFFYRLLGVFAILDVLGTIVTPILKKVYSGKEG
jgi:hypothetical protein